MANGTTLRIDPWAAEYEGMVQLIEEAEPAAVDIRVESSAWSAIRPAPAARPRIIAFVDGVRRIEHRLLVGDRERTVFGLFGSLGVGTVLVDGVARVAHETVGRVAVTGGGLRLEAFLAPIDGGQPLVFEPRSEPDNTPVAPVDGLQKAMRETEAGLAERLSAEVDVVVLDGPLSFLTAAARGRVVGFVKRLLRNYLDPAAHALLARLEVGERTPVFLIEGREPRYSWYVRIARGGPSRRRSPASPGWRRRLPAASRSHGGWPISRPGRCPASRPTPCATRALPRTCSRSAGSRPVSSTSSATPRSCGARSRRSCTAR